MCVGCPDFVDICFQGSCGRTTQEGRLRGNTFYLDSLTFCEHLIALHGTSSPAHYDHFRRYHTGPDCECIQGNWWPGRPEPIIKEEDD